MKKTIFMISQYTKQPQYTGDMRYYDWAKHLLSIGHEVYILCSSAVHNSELNLIEKNEKYRIVDEGGIKYVYIYTPQYIGNGVSRIRNMIYFYFAVLKTMKSLPHPDLIIARSPSPLSCVAGIKFAKRTHTPIISDIVDLWPESIVTYGFLKAKNPLTLLLYQGEKWIYKNSTQLIFSMPGCYDYIIERGWEKQIPRSKVNYINIGVNVNEFDSNAKNYQYKDDKLNDDKLFKVTYSGSVRLVNGVHVLCEAGKYIKEWGYDDICIMIHGAGDQVETLKEYCRNESITQVTLYGRIEKKDIPYVLTHSDLCVLCYQNTPLLRFGGSMNKMFEYFASGRPVITNVKMGHSFIQEYGCGLELNTNDPEKLAEAIVDFYKMDQEKRNEIGNKARNVALLYDINELAKTMYEVVLKATQWEEK